MYGAAFLTSDMFYPLPVTCDLSFCEPQVCPRRPKNAARTSLQSQDGERGENGACGG